MGIRRAGGSGIPHDENGSLTGPPLPGAPGSPEASSAAGPRAASSCGRVCGRGGWLPPSLGLWRVSRNGRGESISRKTPSRCIFFFSALRAWSTLLSRTRTCTRRSSSIERLMGPWPRRPGLLAHGYAHAGADGTRGTNQRRFLKSCLPMAPGLPIGRSGDFGTSPFFGQLFGQASACLVYANNGRAGRKEQ